MFAFIGAHRTGKTTLARAVSERMGLPFVETNVTAALKEAGFDQVADLDHATRLACQKKRLELHMAIVKDAPRPSIMDRSPLDIAAYTIAEFGMHSDPELAAAAHELVEECLEETRSHYHALVLVQPLPLYVMEEGKPPANIGFQHHIHWLIMSLMNGVPGINRGFLTPTALDQRIESSIQMFNLSLRETARLRGQFVFH